MTEHAIVFAVSSDKDFLMCFSALTWKCTALQVAFTCWLKERFESIVTPRFFITTDGAIGQSAILISDALISWEVEASRCLVPMRRTSDLDGFRHSPLLVNQSWRAMVHRLRRSADNSSSPARMPMYSWVSSAYWWNDTPNELITWAMGEVKRLKRFGPSTLPCGTPMVQWVVGEMAFPSLTNCSRPSRYDVSHRRAAPDIPKA